MTEEKVKDVRLPKDKSKREEWYKERGFVKVKCPDTKNTRWVNKDRAKKLLNKETYKFTSV
jgi:hypothetical protein